jgi:hypothetical protein
MREPSRRAMRVPLEQLHEVVASAVETVSARRRSDECPAAATELATLSEEELEQVAAGTAAAKLCLPCPPDPCPPIPKCPPVIAGFIGPVAA